LPQRKNIRLKGYDYSSAGLYFVTICVKDKHELLWDNPPVGAAFGRPLFPEIPLPLSKAGQIVDAEIRKIDQPVVMPNHIHMIISLSMNINGRSLAVPTVSQIVNQFKGSASKQIGYSIWQRSFHDHIIRNEADHHRIAQYVLQNPANWQDDRYYPHQP